MAARSLVVTLGANVSGFVAKMREAEMATKSLASKSLDYTDKHSQNLSKLSTRVGVVGIGIAALGGMAAKSAIEWETAWRGVQKTVNATPAQLSQIEVGLRGLAKSMPETHAQIAAVAEAAGQLGVQTGSIVEFTKTMVMLGDTTNLSADEAATSIAQLMNVMQTAPGDVDNLGAALVALGNNGASTERDIIQMAQRIASAGKIVGLSEANVLGLSNALASTGVEAEAGGTAISQTMIKISQAVSGGGQDLKNWAGVAGMTADQFTTAWKTKPAAALTAVVEGLGKMDKAGGDVFGTLKTLGVDGIRTTTALLNLANGGDMLRKSLALGNSSWKQNTALTREAGLRYDTTAAKAQIAANVLKDDMISAGQALLPMAAKLAESVAAIGNAFGSLPGPVKSSLGVLAGVGGIALIAGAGLIKLTIAIAETRTAMAAMEVSSVGGVSALGKIGKAAAAVTLAFAAAKVAGAAFNSGDRAGVATYTSALLGLSQGAGTAKGQIDKLFHVEGSGSALFGETFKDINNLNDAIGALRPGKLEGLTQGLQSVFTETRKEASMKSFEQVDKALNGLASGGHLQEAAAGFDFFSKKLHDAGFSAKDIAQIFPQYTDTLKSLKNESKTAAKTTDDLGQSLQGVAPLSEEAQKALDAAKQSTIDAAGSFLDLSKNLDAGKYSFQGWIKGLEDMAKAQSNWANNLILATNRGVTDGVIAQLKAMGPAGAKALDDLAHGTQKDIDRVNAAFESGIQTGQNLADVLNGLPPGVITSFKTAGDKNAIKTAAKLAHQYDMTKTQVTTILTALNYTKPQIKAVLKALAELDAQDAKPSVSLDDSGVSPRLKGLLGLLTLTDGYDAQSSVHVDTGDDAKRVGAVSYALAHIPQSQSRTVTLTTVHVTKNKTVNVADGGLITGPGGPRDDLIPANLSNGEFVMNAAATSRNLSLLHRLNAQKFANGGLASRTAETPSSQTDTTGREYMAAGFGGMGGRTNNGQLMATVDVSGLRVRIDKDGLGTFVDSRIDIINGSNKRHVKTAESRKGRR